MTGELEAELAKHGFPGKIAESLYRTDKVQVLKVRAEGFTFVVKNITYPISFPYERAITEVDIILQLDHPNIVKTYSHFWFWSSSSTWQLVILLEYCQKDLMAEIRDLRKHAHMLAEAELLSQFDQLAGVFAFLQSNGIVHRDIKPQNILCSGQTLKVTDFGTAKNCRGFSMRVLRPVTVTGTPYFMSPKLKRGLLDRVAQVPHSEFKSDVYSLGITFLIMSRLETPAAIMNLQSMNRVTSQEIAMVPYSDRLKEVLAWMLVEEEEKRCDFLELQRYLRGMCVQSPPAQPAQPAQPTLAASGCCQHVALSPEVSSIFMPCHGMLCGQCVEVIPLAGERVRYKCKLCNSFHDTSLRAPASLNISLALSEEEAKVANGSASPLTAPSLTLGEGGAKAANDSASSEPIRNKVEDWLYGLPDVDPKKKVSCNECGRVKARELLLPLYSKLLCTNCLRKSEREQHFVYGCSDDR